MLFEISLVVALIALVIATIIDLKTREVPEAISYGIIIIALLLRVFFSYTEKSFSPLLEGLMGFGIFFGVGYVLYRTGQWGGGDTSILGGLGALFGFSLNNTFMISFLVNLMIAGAIYGIFHGVYLAAKHKVKYPKLKYAKALSGTTFVVLILGNLILSEVRLLFTLLILLVAGSYFILNYLSVLEKDVMLKSVVADKLTEGDWIMKDIVVGNKVIKKKNIGLTLKELEVLKKLHSKGKIKKVLIKEGIPFIPSFLIALIMTYFLGNVVIAIITVF